MSIASIFSIAGSGMSAQSVRMNTIASNMANAQTVARSEQEAYKARYPVFVARAMKDSMSVKGTAQTNDFGHILMSSIQSGSEGVKSMSEQGVSVTEIVESKAPVERRYQPAHPFADEEGYVYGSNVNTVEEMADMISASRAFQMNVEIANTAKSMMQRLLTLGQ